jgi:NADH:ubiquinone oxidoreductase subunit 2 (subunit N)
MTKFVLFSSTIQVGMTWLAVVAILNSALSLFYYTRLVKYITSFHLKAIRSEYLSHMQQLFCLQWLAC